MILHHKTSGPADAPALVLGGSPGTSLAMWDEQLEQDLGPAPRRRG